MPSLTIVKRSEYILLLLLAVGLGWGLISVEAFEWIFEFSRAHESWQLDEFIVLVPVMAIVLSVFSVNRYRQIRIEMDHRRIAEQSAFMNATTNAVTGLPNDKVTFEAIQIEAARMPVGGLAVACIHVDHWHVASIRHGTAVAESVMRAVVARISESLPGEAILGCSATDMIIVAAPGYTPDRFVATCLKRIHADLEKAVEADGSAILGGVHIGVSAAARPSDGYQLLDQAQAALMEIRHSGKSGIGLFDPEVEAQKAKRRNLTEAIRIGLARGEVYCQFQPIIDLATRQTVGFEALARWRRADGQVVAPDVFVPLCNEAGCAAELTRVVFDAALSAARHWPEHCFVSVNISRGELAMPQLCAFIRAKLAEHSVAPTRLEIEVTETDELQDAYVSRRNIDALRRMGVKISIDDFGAGFSNLMVLHEIDFDTIKIDRAFATNLAASTKDKAIVAATVALARTLRRSVTIEGIESIASLDEAVAIGCTRAQGYFFSRPLDAEQVQPWLIRTGRPAVAA